MDRPINFQIERAQDSSSPRRIMPAAAIAVATVNAVQPIPLRRAHAGGVRIEAGGPTNLQQHDPSP